MNWHIHSQSELNCETLDASLGLQLRWSLTDETSAEPAILLQLVANTGADRYLAIGIREDQSQMTFAAIGGEGTAKLISNGNETVKSRATSLRGYRLGTTCCIFIAIARERRCHAVLQAQPG